MIKVGALTAMLGACSFASTPETDVLSDWVVNDVFAYGMLKPEAVSPSHATQVAWTGDGVHLLIVHTDRKSDSKSLASDGEQIPVILSEWNRLTGRTRELIRSNGLAEWVSLTPVGKSAGIILRTGQGLFLLDANTARQTSLVAVEVPQRWTISICPAGDRVCINYHASEAAPEKGFARVYNLGGAVVAAGDVPDGMSDGGWSTDGWPVFYARSRDKAKVQAVLRPNGFTAYDGALRSEDEPPIGDIRVVSRQVDPGNQTSIRTAWLQTTIAKPQADDDGDKVSATKALVCADVEETPVLSPAMDAVAYISRGVPMVRRIVKMPREQFDKAVKQAKKLQAMSNSKQAALAAIMYSMDADDAFPLNGNFAEAIDAYLKNPAMARMFTYTFGGGMLPKDANPATFELGYVQGADGRAVAYADGHVKWIPNP